MSQKDNFQPMQAPYSEPHHSDDEIDLFELWQGLMAEKWTIVASFMLAVFLAGIYAFFGAKTYEVKSAFLPPLERSVADMNYLDIASLTPKKAYQTFIENLDPVLLPERLLRDADIKALLDLGTDDEMLRVLSKSITVNLPLESKKKQLMGDSLLSDLTTQYGTSQGALLLNNRIISSVERETKLQIKSDLVKELSVKIENNEREFELSLQQVKQEINSEIERLLTEDDEVRQTLVEEIKGRRARAEEERLLQIQRLESDYLLAKQLKISKPINPLDYQKKSSARDLIDLQGATPSRYWLGTTILSAEIEGLKTRPSNDPYIKGLSELNKQLAALNVNQKVEILKSRTDFVAHSSKLRELSYQKKRLVKALQKVNSADFSVYRLALNPVEPSKPIKPKKALILAVAGVLGLMLGVFIALIRRAIKKRREADSQVI